MLRATLKSMLSRKRRLILSTLAVVLGVMFVSGAFVLTDTLGRSFGGLFRTIYSDTEIQVTKPTDEVSMVGPPLESLIPADRVPVVAAVPGVERATGGIFVPGAKLIDRHGKVAAGSPGAPQFGAAWSGAGDALVEIREGRAPSADGEVMISANLAKNTGYRVGDTVEVATALAPAKQKYTLVGIVGYRSGRDTLAGESMVFFTEPVAQQVMLGAAGVYSEITVDVVSGADIAEVRDRIAAALGPDYAAKTGAELAEENSNSVKEGLKYFNYILLGFAAIALFVGIFIIINTFSITVAQRTRELALLRAVGASRRQVIGSVMAEAVVIGLLASVVGLLLGIGVGAVLASVVGGLIAGGLGLDGVGVPPAAVILAFVVGLGVTLVAALMPALRAARIPPVAAMRDAATPDRPLTALTIAGAGVLAVGGVALTLGLAGALGGGSVWAVLGGVLVCFVGVALLTPVIARPVVAGLGRVLSWGAAGALGRRNSGRNPRRTAITASALMISVAVVTAISLIFASIKASVVEALDVGFDADLVISGDSFSGGFPQIDPSSLERVRALPGVQSVVSQSAEIAKIDGEQTFVVAVDDIDAALTVFRVTPTAGTLRVGPGQVIVDDATAADRGLALGDSVQMTFSRTGDQTLRVVGIYESSPIASGFLVSTADAQAGFRTATPYTAYVKLTPGADERAVLEQVRSAIADNPDINANTVDDWVAGQARVFDIILGMVQLLLALAMVIAVIGLINTLALSMIERTREVGLLRAVGMRRRQIMWMVTAESVVISVFGVLLGIVVGIGLGVAVYQPLKDEGLTQLALPWQLMGIYAVGAVLVGLVAGFVPALGAARQNVLRAIAYE